MSKCADTPPPPYRQQLWRSVSLGPFLRTTALQLVAGVLILLHATPTDRNYWAVIGFTALGIVTLPIGRLVANLSRNHPRAYYWSGRTWAAAVPAIFTLTISDAYDGSGPVFADKMFTPFMVPCAVAICFAIGAQGALLAVPAELTLNMATIMIAMSVIKLRVAYTPTYLFQHFFSLGSIALGYACVSKYADLHEAVRDAAEQLMCAAVAITQPYVITDDQLRILAVNQRFCDVLGYETDEVYGMHASELLETSLDTAWVEAVLSKEQTDHVWSVVRKDQTTTPVRITLAAQRCPVNATKFYCAKLASMALEQRNMQLLCEKERLQWDLASQHGDCDCCDPREALGAHVAEGAPHRTLGAMQDQDQTDEAVSNANSFDHSSTASPTASKRALIAPPPPPKTLSSCVSLESSVMDTISQAAKKSPTRAPPPPKQVSRLPRPKKTSSEPSATKPKAGNNPAKPKRTVPAIERHPGDRS